MRHAFFVVAVALIACASNTDGSPPSSNDALSLDVSSAKQIASVPNAPPVAPDQVLVAIDLTLGNQSGETIPLATVLFSVVTGGGVEFPGSGMTALYPGACAEGASLTPGHSIHCSIVFVTPASDPPTSVQYAAPDLAPVSAPVSIALCTICNGACVDVSSDAMNCGTCGVQVGAGTCVDGKASCDANARSCNGRCLVKDLDSCESCNESCGSWQGVPSDACTNGHCTISVKPNGRVSCAETCAQLSTPCYGVGEADYDCSAHSSDPVDCTTNPAATVDGCHWVSGYCNCGLP